MVVTHSRPSSPEPTSAVKRLKTSHNQPNLSSLPAATGPTVNFADGLLEHNNISRLHSQYKSNGPFQYALVEKLFQDELLNKVKDECLSELSFTEKETDIYKVNQTGDLASLNYLAADQISRLPALLTLRDSLYSHQFREFLRKVTGCGPLSGTKQDMSVNSYTKGCHLLNHDDVIGSRRVSYILYMPLPNFHLWQKDWGGALELYPVNEQNEPEPVPKKSIPPSWNQFIFFEVQPGQSFHSVEEVVVGGEGEDGRTRLSISGWFHAAQEGEEGYVSEDISSKVNKSSREQLASTSTVFNEYPSTKGKEEGAPLPDAPLSDEHVNFLSEYLNPVYLQPRTMNALASRFVDESSLELHQFLNEPLAAALEPRLRELDFRDGLGPEREGKVPPHDSGVNLTSTTTNSAGASSGEGVNTVTITTAVDDDGSSSSQWTLKGPPHKWRYCTLLPTPPSAPATLITPLSAHPDPSAILRALQDELFPSPAFRAWLAKVSSLLPLKYAVEARRFRPGLDYTLATSEEKEARLDVCLGLTPEVVDDDSEDKGKRERTSSGKKTRGWAVAEWGGWECYMAPHNEEDDPAVYRSSMHKRQNGQQQAATNGVTTNGTQTNGKPSPKANGKSSTSPEPEDAMDEDADEEEEEDSTLLTVQPGFNRLLLVLRDERVMRFVKYVSAAAEGSRWDVCGEYEVGAIQEEEDEDEDD